jgi:hypothetical protein
MAKRDGQLCVKILVHFVELSVLLTGGCYDMVFTVIGVSSRF